MPILQEFKIKVAEYLSRLKACYTELLEVKRLLVQEIRYLESYKVTQELNVYRFFKELGVFKDPFRFKTTPELERELKELNDQISLLLCGSDSSGAVNLLKLKANAIEDTLKCRNIVMLGLLKLNDVEIKLNKAMSGIEALLLRLPAALAAVLAILNARTQKEMQNALAKALIVLKRVEGLNALLGQHIGK
jgi:hypothetical protein